MWAQSLVQCARRACMVSFLADGPTDPNVGSSAALAAPEKLFHCARQRCYCVSPFLAMGAARSWRVVRNRGHVCPSRFAAFASQSSANRRAIDHSIGLNTSEANGGQGPHCDELGLFRRLGWLGPYRPSRLGLSSGDTGKAVSIARRWRRADQCSNRFCSVEVARLTLMAANPPSPGWFGCDVCVVGSSHYCCTPLVGRPAIGS